MRLLLNIIWLVLSGLWLAIGYAFAGVALWPFGREIVPAHELAGAYAGTRHEGALMPPPIDLPSNRPPS